MSIEELKARAKALSTLERKVGALSKRLEKVESGKGAGSATYKRLKPRMDRSRAKVYDKILAVRKELEALWAEHGLTDSESIALTEELEEEEAIKAAALAKWETLDDDVRTDAAWSIAEDLQGLNADQLKAALSVIDDKDRLMGMLAQLDLQGSDDGESSDERRRLEKAVLTRLKEVTVYEDSVALFKKILKTKGSTPDDADMRRLQLLTANMPKEQILRIEKEMALWPESGDAYKKTKVLDLVTGQNRGTDEEESARGNFTRDEGEAIKKKLFEHIDNEEFDFGQCMAFVYGEAMDDVFDSDEEQALLEEAKQAYEDGVAERNDEGGLYADSFSRIAQEARQRGLMGPVNLLDWHGKSMENSEGKKVMDPHNGRHRPSAGDVLDRLSNGNDGWYFFFAGVKNYHSIMIAVEKSGQSKDYWRIQDAKKKRYSKSGISDYFDSFDFNEAAAGSRIWQAYVSPTG